MSRFFISIYDFFVNHRPLMWVFLSVVVAGIAISVSGISFSEDIADFLPQSSNNKKINYAYQHIGGSNTIIVSFAMKDSTATTDKEMIIESIDTFVRLMEEGDGKDHIAKMEYVVNQDKIVSVMRFVTDNLPYFITEEDYARIDTLIRPENIKRTLAYQKGLLMTPVGGVLKYNIGIDPLSISAPVLNALNNFKLGDSYHLYDDYIFSSDEKEGIVTITSKYSTSESRGNGKLMDAIDCAAQQTVADFDGISIVPFGASYIAKTNSSQITEDALIAVILAVILILALLLYYFRTLYPVMMVMIPILFGVLFSLACIALFKDKVSIIAISIGSIMVGIAANYPLHYLTHRYQGYSDRQTLNDISKPLTTGNITTVGAFLSLLFISSAAMRDLGMFASLLLVGTILFVLIFLPHIVGKVRSRNGKLAFPFISALRFENSRFSIIIVAVITVFLCFFNSRVTFDTNMSNINYMTPAQKLQMEKMNLQMQGGKHVVYYVNQGSTVESALQSYEESSDGVKSVINEVNSDVTISGIGNFIPSQEMQKVRLFRWNEYWKGKSEALISNLNTIGAELNYKKGAFSEFERLITTEYTPKDYTYFNPLINQFAGNYLSIEQGNTLVYSIVRIATDYAPQLIDTLNTYIPESLFAFDAGSVTREMVNNLSGDFDYVLYICGFIVFAFLLISFGRIELTAISFLPLALSWIWILGLMGIFGMNFNIVNIILATFIFGMGDDYTIFIAEGMLYENAHNRKMVDTYKDTIMLSALIMFAGIGTLIFAKHQALRSLAQVTMVGMFSVVLMAYIITPVIFRWLTVRKGRRRKEPITLYNWCVSVISFIVFLVGSLIITIYGFITLTILGKTQRHKLSYHKLIRFVAGLVIRVIPGTKFKYINNVGETFKKPSIIIANHQSHLDLMAVLMLNPKIIVITNDWVWHSPFYGILIRYADFFPMEDFISKDISYIGKMVQQGYSIMVFPEGTRSLDCSILRFHKGAFYLSRELGLDILPVVLHGFGYVLPKDSLLVRKGEMSVTVLPRMPFDPTSELTYSEMAKNMRKLFVKEYDIICKNVENADYYATEVIHNYVYKGIEVEREVRKNFRDNDNFRYAVNNLPRAGSVTIVDKGYGEFALIAALVRKELTISAVIEDDIRREIAENCVSKPENLKYTGNE